MEFLKYLKVILPSLLFLVLSCNKNNDETTEIINLPPESALLIYPENNTECYDGIVVSDNEADVLFQWEKSSNTGSYLLTINNLNDGSSKQITTQKTEFLVRLLRGTPYSWQVKSNGLNNSGSAASEVWRFYNAGIPDQSHPPFPANALNPESGELVNAGSLLLQWEVSDIDNDIATYKILLDTITPPAKVLGNSSTLSIEAQVNAGNIYYWQIITTDLLGNVSNSPVFQFQVAP